MQGAASKLDKWQECAGSDPVEQNCILAIRYGQDDGWLRTLSAASNPVVAHFISVIKAGIH